MRVRCKTRVSHDGELHEAGSILEVSAELAAHMVERDLGELVTAAASPSPPPPDEPAEVVDDDRPTPAPEEPTKPAGRARGRGGR